jgi:hypothetical protein
MKWTGQIYVDDNVCQTCYQPECSESAGGERPRSGTNATRLERGCREYRGYCEWVVHPDEARAVLHRGYAIVDGRETHVTFVHNEAYVTQLRVDGSDTSYVLEEKFLEPAAVEEVAA